MNNVKDLFEQLKPNVALTKMKIDNCPINVYYGYSETGKLRLAFLTENAPIVIESTANLQVKQWAESMNVYWTCFDLLSEQAKLVYYVLCENLIKSAMGCSTEESALSAIKNRFITWKNLFKKSSSPMSEEMYKGLFGELYFLKKWLIPHYNVNVAINSWSGPTKTAKDFAVLNEWYEIKTISTNAETIRISSLTQLESDNKGSLVVVNTEKMASEYDDGECMVSQLLNSIIDVIGDEIVKDIFIEKVSNYGYSADDENALSYKYRVSKMKFYCVDKNFPKITSNEVPYSEIVRVKYELSVSAIEKYLEGEI